MGQICIPSNSAILETKCHSIAHYLRGKERQILYQRPHASGTHRVHVLPDVRNHRHILLLFLWTFSAPQRAVAMAKRYLCALKCQAYRLLHMEIKIKNTFGGQIFEKEPQQRANNSFPFVLGFIIIGAKCTQQGINLGLVDAKWCEFSHWNNSSKVLPHGTDFRGG